MDEDDLIPVRWSEFKQVIEMLGEVANILASILEDLDEEAPGLYLVKKDDEEKGH